MIEFVAVIVAGAVMVVTFKRFFGDMAGFLNCLKFWATPDSVSWVKGEYHEDCHAEFVLFLWIALGAAVGAGVFYGLTVLFR